MLTLQEIKQQPIPQHIAVIMDGNGRWAKEHGQQRLAGHQQGAHALREVMEGSIMLGVQYLTVYAFSIENWNRSQDEVLGLMQLFVHTCKEELPTLQKYGVCFHAIGNLSMLDNYCREAIQEVEEKTIYVERNSGFNTFEVIIIIVIVGEATCFPLSSPIISLFVSTVKW